MWNGYHPGYPNSQEEDVKIKKSSEEDSFFGEDDSYLISETQRRESKEQWEKLKAYVEQFSGQKLSEGDLKVNMLKKINHTIKLLLDEVVSMDEHIKYLEGKKSKGHPLYPEDPYNSRGGNF